jgi:hypothetical protein
MVKSMVAFFPNCWQPSGAMSILVALISLVMVCTTLTGLDSDARIAEIHEIGNLFTENYQYSFFPSLCRAGGETTSQEQSKHAKEENPGLFHHGNQNMARSSNSENGPKKVIDVISLKNEQISHEICSSNGHDGFSNTHNDLPLPIAGKTGQEKHFSKIGFVHFPDQETNVSSMGRSWPLQDIPVTACHHFSSPVTTIHHHSPPFTIFKIFTIFHLFSVEFTKITKITKITKVITSTKFNCFWKLCNCRGWVPGQLGSHTTGLKLLHKLHSTGPR